ncbi:MAG TPA: c-type cytochrome biogenesis protein CcmI, partial [Paracoccaceae bacterium]|nr:c-type cytochrome biogenesis protein CcmI [Paracoccaceae bacterium]
MAIFWAIVVAMTLIVGGVLAQAVIRGAARTPSARASSDAAVYRAQLAEVDRDVARGVIDAADADRVHAEIARRLIAADRAAHAAQTRSTRAPASVALGLIGLGLAGSVGTYLWLGAPGYGDMALQDRIAFAEEVRSTRPDQQVAEASLPPFVPPADLGDDYRRLLTQLRETVAKRPNDLQGHILLAQQERRIGNFSAAKEAQHRVVEIRAEDVTASELADLGELQVMAA